MSDDAKHAGRTTAIGAFVLGGFIIAVGSIILFGKINLFSPTSRVVIVFQDSISGLAIGAPVTFRGVRVGAVESIAVEFDTKTQKAFIPITLELQSTRVVMMGDEPDHMPDLSDLVRLGLRAQLNTQSFVTGQSEIDLELDPSVPAVMHPGITTLPEIPTQQSTIQKVKEQLSQLPLRELADNANATLQSLRTLSETFDHTLPPLIASLQATSEHSAAVVEEAGHALAEMQSRVDGTLGDISRLANAGTALIGERGAELHTVLSSSNQTVLQARTLLLDLKSLTSERGADRANIDSSLRDLATAAAALRGLANDVEHNPQLLLTGRRP